MTDEKSTDHVEDQELNDLLDSALQDFNKETLAETKDDSATKSNDTASKEEADDALEDAWTRDFIRQAADQFEENLQHFMQNGADTELGASFQKMAQTVASVMSETEGVDVNGTNTDFQSAITKALSDLTASSENLQNDADLSELLGQTSLEDGILPLMQGVLHHLLSKEMLYPPLKEFVDKYPSWLEEKKDTLSADDLERYTKQLELLKKVCAELEKEKPDDTDEAKEGRFKMIVSLLEQTQNYGQLPEELVGDQANPFQFDGEGEAVVPALLRGMDSPQNCNVM